MFILIAVGPWRYAARQSGARAWQPTSKADWVERLPKSANREKFMAGRWDAGDLGSTVPEDYRLYMALGRFRNALVVAEEKRNPSEHLTKFINTYGLHPFRVAKR